ncbi:hypothetical protein EV360DRAFT_67243 [Lentinula raphanica]|nr:hypothetical protein EV360DRAFT_67243 [Lentinula raphanica]
MCSINPGPHWCCLCKNENKPAEPGIEPGPPAFPVQCSTTELLGHIPMDVGFTILTAWTYVRVTSILVQVWMSNSRGQWRANHATTLEEWRLIICQLNNSESHENAEYGQVTETRFRTPSPPNLPPQPSASSSSSRPTSFFHHPDSSHTPAKAKAAISSGFCHAPGIEEKRQLIVKSDMSDMIPEVPVEDFFHSILPPLLHSQEELIGKVIAKLEGNGTIDKDNDCWSAFREDPCKHSEHGSQAFQGLTLMWERVISAAKEVDGSLEQTFKLIVSGHVYIHSDQTRLCQPDAFNKKMPEERHFVYDIANPYQFKKDHGVTQIIEDFSKVLFDMEQVLARDPRRRFTFGTTIENRMTRLWFLSHATLLRSTSFDFMTDRRLLVHLFLSLAFSFLQDLGWDTTMSLSHVDSSRWRQYNIDVNGHTFTTMEVLSDASADSPLGRATRVWKVKDSDGKERVLKDVWLETDRKEEHVILEEILESTKLIKPDPELDVNYYEELQKRMLKPTAHCSVLVDDKTVEGDPAKGQPDNTGVIMLRGYDLGGAKLVKLLPDRASTPAPPPSITYSMPGDRDFVPLSSSRLADRLNDANSEHLDSSVVSSPQDTLEQVDQTDAINAAQRKVVTYPGRHRYHYRIVFEQCATTMHDERSLGNVLNALLEVSRALWIMYLAGWVHRDISGGNVYWFERGQMGLLGDFEYAVQNTNERRHDVRTGTPFFMAAETIVESGKVFFKLEEKQETEFPVVDDPKSALAFSYNPLHDLESIWWILVYVLFFNDAEFLRSRNAESREEKMEKLFHGRLDVTDRQPFLRNVNDGAIADLQECLSPSFLPALNLLVKLASTLVGAYENAEKTHPSRKIDKLCFGIHGTFMELFMYKKYIEPLKTIRLVPVKATAKEQISSTLIDMDSERPSKRSKTSANGGSSGSNLRMGQNSRRRGSSTPPLDDYYYGSTVTTGKPRSSAHCTSSLGAVSVSVEDTDTG